MSSPGAPDAPPRPVVAITSMVVAASWSSWRDVPAALSPYAYVRQVVAAGGTGVVLPPLPEGATEADAENLLRRVDGIIITGGADVESRRYGAPAHALAQPPQRDRDASELLLVQAAAAAGVPLLGVCRGMQVMAVAAGGTLEQHLPDRLASRRHAPYVDSYGLHAVTVAPGSRLHAILGDEVTVATYHHQGVLAAPGYRLCAWADDGVLEAIEDPDADFRVGVQWHPEVGEDPRLFAHLVLAARRYATRVPAP